MNHRDCFSKSLIGALFIFLLMGSPCLTAGMDSANYTVSCLTQNQGSGLRDSSAYQISMDAISMQPNGMMSGDNHSLAGSAIAPQDHMVAGVFINDNAPATTSVAVTLGLICGHSSGCSQMKFSNNGVSWSAPEPYSTAKSWNLLGNEGNRTVYAKYQNGLGEWSGMCSDSIMLDMTAPAVTISPAGDTYMADPLVTLTASEPATIYYTNCGTPCNLNGLVAYYSFDGDADDETDNGHDGSVNGAALTTDRFGNPNSAYSFDGQNAYIEVPGNQDLYPGNHSYTVCAWIKVDGTSDRMFIIHNQDGWVDQCVNLKIESSGAVAFLYQDVNNSERVSIETSEDVCDNQWHFVAGIRDRSEGLAKIYVDGALKASGPDSDANVVISESNQLNIGRRGPPNDEAYFGGQLDDIRIYNQALSESEIQALYSQQNSSICICLDPTADSPIYSSPFALTEDATVKAFARDEAGNTGPVATEEYIVCNGANMSISGVVKDGFLDEPMPLATVTLDSGHTADTIDGEYSFGSLPMGYYKIVSITIPTPAGYVSYQKEIILCKDSVVHDIALTKAETMFGGDTFAGYSVDSVNTATGNFFYDVTDLEIPGRGLPFGFDRTYNSQDDRDGPLGYGWTHNYNVSLTVGSANEVTVRWGDGKAATWTYDETEGYTPMKGVFDTLTQSENKFTVTRKDMIEYHFDTSHRLSAIKDENGNTLTFEYTGDLMTRVVDTVGRHIDFAYDTEGRIVQVLDPINRSVNFTYDLNGNLATSINLGGKTTSYTYDSDHQMLTLTDPMGNDVYTNTYDEQRRVIASQRDPLGNQTLYNYDVPTRTTQIVHPNGSSSYHSYDDLLRLIQEKDPLENSAYYEYSDSGSLSKVTDKNGNVTTYQTDEGGNVQVKMDPLGNETSATYDDNNNPLTKTDANGNATEFDYDTNGNLLTLEDALGNTTTFTYNAYGQLLTRTDALGVTTRHEYDVSGNHISVIHAVGTPLETRSDFTYDGVGRKGRESHPLERGVAYEYDDMDRLVSVTDALGGVAVFTYDDNGNKTEHTDANGHTRAFGYDAKNRLVTETTPLNETETYTYDSMDRRTDVINRRGKVSWVVYDDTGNVIQLRDADGNMVRHQYDANGNRTATTDANNHTTTFGYDPLNRLIKTTDPYGKFTTRTYDANGNLRTTTDPIGKTVHYAYDELNRLISITDPLNNVTTNEYDAVGRLIKVRDAKGNETSYEYDALGRLIKVTDAASGVVEAEYDALGNRISVTDPRGNETHYAYDRLNRLIQVTDPLNNTQQMHYDAVGNLIVTVEPDGISTHTYTYDKNNRPSTVSYPDAGTNVAAYQYDANGNRVSVADVMGTTSYTYDNRDALSSVTDPFGMTVGYFYDPNGNRTVIEYPGTNKRVIYSYDSLNRLSTVRDWNYVQTSYQYDDAGRLVGKTMGNGATVSYSYDDAGRLVLKEDKTAQGDVIARYDISLDEVGNRTGMTMTQPLTPSVEAVEIAFNHDEGNRLLSANSVTFTYDSKGNRVGRNDGTVTTQYAYDYRNMLTQVSDGTYVQEYGYNSDGHRLKAVRDGVETRYVLDVNRGMESILAEMDQTNTISKYFIYGDGLLQSIDAATDMPVYYHYDTIGSTVALTDHSGSITDQYAYLPFGEPAGREAVHDNAFTYVGKYGVMEEPSGLYFMRARYYDPEMKRFLSVDPIQGEMKNSQTMSPYPYALGNPASSIDPKGLFSSYISMGWDILTVIAPAVEDGFKAMDGNMTVGEWAVRRIPLVGETISINEGFYDGVEGKERASKIDLFYAGAHYLGQIFSEPVNDFFEDVGNKAKSVYKDVEKVVESGIICYSGDSEPENILISITSKVLSQPNDREEPATLNSGPSQSGSPQPSQVPKLLDPGYVFDYTRGHYRQEFSKLLNSSFIDNQARSYIEARIYREAASRAQTRYRIEKKDDMKTDVRRRIGSLKKNFTQTLSKYSVLVKDLSDLPDFNSLNMNRRGVYAGK